MLTHWLLGQQLFLARNCEEVQGLVAVVVSLQVMLPRHGSQLHVAMFTLLHLCALSEFEVCGCACANP